MKNIKFISIIALVLLIAGCSMDGFAPDQYKAGKSKVTISIGGNARTILPVLDYDDFKNYTIEAEKGGVKVGPFNMNYETYALFLDPGTWTVTVKAFFDGVVDNAGKPIAVAKGSINITVADEDISGTVIINVPEAGGLGTFNYSILSGSAGVSVKLFAFNAATKEFAATPIYNYAVNKAAVELASGIYLLSVEANGKTEIDVVHIYNGQTSYASFDFDAEVLGSYSGNDMNNYTPLYSVKQYQIVNVDDRENVLMVSNVTAYAAAVYGINDYFDADVTINFSAEVKRIGAAGALIWRINGDGYPQLSSVNNAPEGVWQTMTGTFTGTNSGYIIYLDTYGDDNSEKTTYYIANFEVTITVDETSTSPAYYDGDWGNVKYNLPLNSYYNGSFYVLDDDGNPLDYLHSPLTKAGSPVLISRFRGLNVTGRANTWDGLDINVTGEISSLSANPGESSWGYGIDTSTNNYKVTVSGNALGVVPAGAQMQMQAMTPSPSSYGSTISGAINATDKTFTFTWNINDTFTYERLRIQTNEAAKAMSFRVNQIIVEDLGPRAVGPTSLAITVDGAAQDVTLTATGGSAQILQDSNGYTFTQTADWDGAWVKFTINLNDKNLADFEKVTYTVVGSGTDFEYKNTGVLAAVTLPASLPTNAQASNYCVTDAPNYSTGTYNATRIIDSVKAKAVTGNVIEASIFIRAPNTAIYTVSNINFVLGELCIVCGKFPCECFQAVTGVPVMQTLGFVDVPIYLPAQALPTNADNRNIVWSVVSGGATLAGNVLTPTGAGSVVLKATVTNGLTASTDYVKDDITITISAVPAPAGELNITNFAERAFGYNSSIVGGNTWKINGSYQRAGFAIGGSVASTTHESVTITYAADYQVRFGFWTAASGSPIGEESGWTYLPANETTRTINIPAGSTITHFGFDSATDNDTLLTIVRVSFKEGSAVVDITDGMTNVMRGAEGTPWYTDGSNGTSTATADGIVVTDITAGYCGLALQPGLGGGGTPTTWTVGQKIVVRGKVDSVSEGGTVDMVLQGSGGGYGIVATAAGKSAGDTFELVIEITSDNVEDIVADGNLTIRGSGDQLIGGGYTITGIWLKNP